VATARGARAAKVAGLVEPAALDGALCIEWQDEQLTMDFAWEPYIRPVIVSWFLWQVRQAFSFSRASSLPGLTMSAGSADSACLAPGPWQDSHALPCQPRCLLVSTE
jgi:hypothetical protein